MEEKNKGALMKAKEEFKEGDPFLMADCSGAVFEEIEEGKGIFKLRYLNQDYMIKFPEGEITFADDFKEDKLQFEKNGCGRPINKGNREEENEDHTGDTILISDQVLMLYYLRNASGLPPKGRWINFLELPQGGHHHSCFIEDAITPLVNKLAGKKENFFKGVEALGGEKGEMGDYSAIIPVFPKLNQAFIIWEGDDEFPAKGNIIFDAIISTYLDTASIYVMGINATLRLINRALI